MPNHDRHRYSENQLKQHCPWLNLPTFIVGLTPFTSTLQNTVRVILVQNPDHLIHILNLANTATTP